MKVLVACEFSGTVRDAFIGFGHDAISCDLLPTERPGPHHMGDVRPLLRRDWDLVIAHPPCTYLAASGARWWKERHREQFEAMLFFMDCVRACAPMVAIENPVGYMNSNFRKPDQIIQPWMFGHGEVKTTCLWLKGLPKLTPTQIVPGRDQKCWKQPQHKDRWKRRARTYPGIAYAMAMQWGASPQPGIYPQETRLQPGTYEPMEDSP